MIYRLAQWFVKSLSFFITGHPHNRWIPLDWEVSRNERFALLYSDCIIMHIFYIINWLIASFDVYWWGRQYCNTIHKLPNLIKIMRFGNLCELWIGNSSSKNVECYATKREERKTDKNSWNDIKTLYSHKRVYMRSAENKYLKTISRVFGLTVEKALPVML